MATRVSRREPRQNHLSIQPCTMGTLSGSCSSRNLMHSMPSVMWRLSSLCALKPEVTVDLSPLCPAPLRKGTNSRLVSTYSKLKLTAVRNPNEPLVQASSKKLLGTLRYHTRSNQWFEWCMPLKYLL